MTTTFVAPSVPSDDTCSVKHPHGIILITKAASRLRRPSTRKPARGVHGGIPSFFRAACYTAAQGGGSGYASAGWHLANSVGTQVPYDLDPDEWAEEIEILQKFASQSDDRAVWGWFAAHFPRAMTLVPAGRRDQFAEGVRRSWEEERITA